MDTLEEYGQKTKYEILLKTFSEISSLISLGKDRSIIFNEIIKSALNILPAKTVYLIIQEDDKVKKYKGLSRKGGRSVDITDIPNTSGIYNWLRRELTSKKIDTRGIFSLDLSTIAEECCSEREESSAIISAPLMSKSSVFGIIMAINESRDSVFRECDIHYLNTLANQAAIAYENYLLYKKLKYESITDELTGVYNYRFLIRSLKIEIKRVLRFGGFFSFMMVDVDNLKEYNDRNGHLYGSRALKMIGGIIESQCREVDTVAKYGGDEFALILPRTDLNGAKLLGERILKAVYDFEFGEQRRGVLTCSMGVSIFPYHSSDLKELIRRADTALYSAKEEGKNTVRVYREIDNKLEKS
ncbi:MAG: diguanylate cyclase [Candidatus Latescibacteria bacterium]|nr:diguanylate cyclase [bacterium]MBD3422930.1 diguanylate cyclase [Candidatus Latescibacterota bacterium]